LIADASTPELRCKEMIRVFHKIMTKACNARFGKIVKKYAEKNAMKDQGKLAFRASLLTPDTFEQFKFSSH